jgi:membrane protein
VEARAAPQQAASPAEISGRGWAAVLRGSARAMVAEEMSVAAAGIAFYLVWAFFPALVVLVVLAALVLGKAEVLAAVSWIRLDLPDTFNALVVNQLDAIAEHSRRVSIATVLGALAFAMWSGMRGARGLMTALNFVYGQEEQRGFWRRQAIAFGLCLLGGLFVLAALALIVGFAGSGLALNAERGFLAPSRWPALVLMMMFLLSVAYRYGPSRRIAKWRWVTWGATAGATVWVMSSVLLSAYTARFSHLNPLLGSLGSVMIFLFWCYLTVLAILLGAHINAGLERQTTVDSGSGAARPVGERGAEVADTVPKRDGA